MLFDNSGSLDAAREFEKQAAMRFFRRVLRPKDEAAIYSIETDSYLAQPLTSERSVARANYRDLWQTRRWNFIVRCDSRCRQLLASVSGPPCDSDRFRRN